MTNPILEWMIDLTSRMVMVDRGEWGYPALSRMSRNQVCQWDLRCQDSPEKITLEVMQEGKSSWTTVMGKISHTSFRTTEDMKTSKLQTHTQRDSQLTVEVRCLVDLHLLWNPTRWENSSVRFVILSNILARERYPERRRFDGVRPGF